MPNADQHVDVLRPILCRQVRPPYSARGGRNGMWTVVGAGRIGGALAVRAVAKHRPMRLLGRDDDWQVLQETSHEPILVCTRNDDLPVVVARVPAQRRGDLVFVQNGMLRPWLAAQDLQNATRGLLFFAVQARGAPMDLGPPSPFCGPHAHAVVTELQALDVPAEEVDKQHFAALELEKLLWNCMFGLLCQAHACLVGEVLTRYPQEVAELTAELLPVGETALDVQLDAATVLRQLLDYSAAIAQNRAAVKEWPWRNGWFVEEAARQNRAMPLHARLCQMAGV